MAQGFPWILQLYLCLRYGTGNMTLGRAFQPNSYRETEYLTDVSTIIQLHRPKTTASIGK
jgi:hypothetical protein